MRNLIAILSLLVFISCGTSTEKKEESKANSDQTEQTTDANEDVKADDASASCEEFLDDYEEWVNEILEVYKKVKENPTDVANTQKLMEVTQEMSTWSERWTELYMCSESEEYAERMEKLQEKVDKVMEQ